MEAENYIVQDLGKIDTPKDREVLHRPLFNVNMRLFKSSNEYHDLILSVVTYMDKILSSEFKDYRQPRGISGANLGVPFNIIGIREPDGNKFYLNPEIVNRSKEMALVNSNCGSLRLPTAIQVYRRIWIDLAYYNLEGEKQIRKSIRGSIANTIQHEVDHNLGVMINDHNHWETHSIRVEDR